MNFTLNQLEVFLKITQTLSITKAAEELHLSQPAVSIQLKNFQSQFDLPLTELIGRKLFITDFGREVAEHVQQIVGQISSIKFKTQAYKTAIAGKLRISLVSTAQYIMPAFLTDFNKKFPGIEISLLITDKSGLIKSLEKNEVDFSVVSILPESMDLQSLPIMENKLVLVRRPTKNKSKKKFERKFISTVPMIFREQGSGTRFLIERYCKKHQLPLFKKMELSTNEAVKQAVIADLGYALIPLVSLKNELAAQELEILPVHGLPLISQWELIWQKNKHLSMAATTFLDYFRSQKASIVSQKFAWLETID